MADIICRWRNGTPKTVVELVNSMPHEVMFSDRFRDIMSTQWDGDFFRTPYQLACQLGLYYESEDGYFHPRFDHDITTEEAEKYLYHWLPRYYIPNPYISKKGFNDIECPTFFLRTLYEYVKAHPNCNYHDACLACFKEEAKNNDDIIRNYINNYSRILTFSTNGKLNITDANPFTIFPAMDRTDRKSFFESFNTDTIPSFKFEDASDNLKSLIRAIRTKPFVLLAGISGTGKSRIVRKLAQACWEPGSDEAKAHKPSNFEMVQVKPNWHDSSELLGYVSRIGDKPQFIVGDFLKFIAKAWENPTVPYFLCLDEMNLAPVEQYFAEYLSVVESRKLQDDGKTILSDPLVKKEDEEWYHTLVVSITSTEKIKNQFLKEGIAIPQNMIVVGTVNMDESTYSFSRKVLDRAMTIEMNEVDLRGGLHKSDDMLPYIEPAQILADAVEGFDVYDQNQESCDKVITYLDAVNKILDKTPFKVAYRTRNEFLIYTVNSLKLAGEDADISATISNALDEVTSMKILSRIEGDKRKVGFLSELKNVIKTGLAEIDGIERSKDNSVSLSKLTTMEERLKSGYTSFWD